MHALTLLVLVTGGYADGDQAAGATASLGPPVLAGCEVDYPPYCVVTPDQQADGFSVELLRAALAAVGRDVAFTTGLWPEMKQALADGRIQALPLVGRTPEREAVYDFTFPYLTMHGAIVIREDTTDIQSAVDLRGRRVAVLEGDNAEEYLHRAELGAVVVPRPSFELALRKLSAGQHDAVVIQKLLAYQLIERTDLKNLRTVGPPLKDLSQSFCFAVRDGDTELLAALNEGLAIVIADGSFRRLHEKWFAALEATGRARSRVVVGGDSNYPPYEYLDSNGQPAGFNVDLTNAVARQMGLTVVVRLAPWSTIRGGLASGDVDVVQGMFYSTERDKELDFSPPTTVVQHSIVVRRGSPPLSTVKDLAGRSILVMAGDIMEELARSRGLGEQLVAVPSQEEALRRLAAGEHDCALVASVPALYWIAEHGWHNLKVSDQPVLAAEYCYAVPGDNGELLAEFSEGLAALKSTGEYRRIQAHWLGPYQAQTPDLRTVTRYVLAAVLPLLALLAGSILWSRSLKRQVAIRTRELALKSALLEALAEATLDGVLVVDEAGQILLTNTRFGQMWSIPADVIATRDDRRVLASVQDQLEEPEAFLATVEHFYRHRDERCHDEVELKGGRLFERYSIPLAGRDGAHFGRVWFFRDITERRRLEEHILLAQRMEAVGNLAGGVAHDFNNLFQSMLSHTHLVRSQPDDPDAVAALGQQLEEEVQRGASLTRQLLLFSRRETAKPEVVDLNQTVREADSMLRRLVPESVAFELELTAGQLPVRADRGQLAQVLVNLVRNAADAMPNGGRLVVRTGGDEGEHVWLSVRDTGHGIPDAVRQHIFDPFFTTKAPGKGTGTGLPVVHSIVTQCGGRVEVESTVGVGTTFRVALPRVAFEPGPAREPARTAAAGTPRGAGQRVLVVEDEDGARAGLRLTLRSLGYDVTAVASGEKAVGLPHEPPFEALLTDLVLPGIPGSEVARELQQRWPGLRVVMMSGYTADEAVRAAVRDGAVRFLQKPFDMATLAQELEAALT